MRRLNNSIEALAHSYLVQGIVNRSGGGALPNRESIMSILLGLNELLFPGFGGLEDLSHDLRLITGEQVYHVARDLMREVEKSVAFSSRKGGRFSCGKEGCRAAAELMVEDFFEELPKIRGALILDMEAAFKGDPAAKSIEEVLLSYPGFEAVMAHRLAHFFWIREVPFIPRMMSELVHSRTGIDIHPGARIGGSFFIDHGTGVVIGETTIIGNNVKLYQGVTLGALSVKKDEADLKRHPTIEDDVTIYSGATILGGGTVIGRGSVIGGNVWLTKPVPPYTMVYNNAGNQVIREQRADNTR